MLESILDRRSIRNYKDTPVTEDELHALLECAMYAPSAKNGRPWRFVVIDDRAVILKLAENHPFGKALNTAPMCICVCGVEGELKGYYVQDCAAATMNILTAAKELGLGSCWLGVAPREDRMEMVRNILGIPDEVKPFSLIALGHAATERRIRPNRWDGSMIHKNKW